LPLNDDVPSTPHNPRITGGDAPTKAADLIIKLISDESADTNGLFCWIENPLQAPIPSWDKPQDSRPWL